MPQQIRGRGEGRQSDNPVDELLHCHERIREFVALAGRLAPGQPASDAEVAEAAAGVLRYFTHALPRHDRDEEESLVPALLAAGAPPELREALERMSEEHGPIRQAVADGEPLWMQLANEPDKRADLGPELAAVAARLKELFDVHLPAEENVIFPAVARLPADVLERIRGEMRARRDKRT